MNIKDVSINFLKSSQSDTQIQNTTSFLPSVLNSCDYCHNENSKLSICGRCKSVYYCGRECQKSAWKTHEIVCFNHPLIPKENEIVCKLKDSEGVRDISQKEFTERLQSRFVTAPLFSKKTLGCDLVKSPRVLIDSVALSYQGETLGYGLVALRDIRKGEIICSFGGQVIHQNDWNNKTPSARADLYSVGASDYVCDPSQFASLGTVANDGLPNCELKTLSSPSNVQIPFDKVVFAVRDIQEGEMIYVDYGWEHPIKRAPYTLDENTIKNLIQKFSEGLDVELLNRSGWVYTAAVQSNKGNSDLVKATEIEYVLTTPYALALLHLKTHLNPEDSLKGIKKLSSEIQRKFKKELDVASVILTGLTQIKETEKEQFLDIASKISQDSLVFLCEFLSEQKSQPSMKECETFGKALDSLRLKFLGSLIGSYWTSTEGAEFEKLFTSKEHQESLLDSTDIQDLPIEFKNSYLFKRNQYFMWIQQYLHG